MAWHAFCDDVGSKGSLVVLTCLNFRHFTFIDRLSRPARPRLPHITFTMTGRRSLQIPHTRALPLSDPEAQSEIGLDFDFIHGCRILPKGKQPAEHSLGEDSLIHVTSSASKRPPMSGSHRSQESDCVNILRRGSVDCSPSEPRDLPVKIDILMELGEFTASECETALRASYFDADRAATYLLTDRVQFQNSARSHNDHNMTEFNRLHQIMVGTMKH
jgi:hypothetical protein